MKFSVCKLAVPMCLLLLWNATAHSEKVIAVHDGDTITVEGGRRIRLPGIDAPELSQPHGEASGAYLREKLIGQDVSLNCLSKSYGRDVCSVMLDGVNVQGMLVLLGMAYDYPQYSQGRYQAEQDMAQKYRLGVWQQLDGGLKPWIYRRFRSL